MKPGPLAAEASTIRASRRNVRIALLALVVAGFLAWANSFSAPFVFDDRPAILANPTLHDLTAALSPPRDGGTVAGRPLVNVSLALNHAISGTDVWSYHVTNLMIHLIAGLTLFGLIHHTLSTLNLQLSTRLAFSATCFGSSTRSKPPPSPTRSNAPNRSAPSSFSSRSTASPAPQSVIY